MTRCGSVHHGNRNLGPSRPPRSRPTPPSPRSAAPSPRARSGRRQGHLDQQPDVLQLPVALRVRTADLRGGDRNGRHDRVLHGRRHRSRRRFRGAGDGLQPRRGERGRHVGAGRSRRARRTRSCRRSPEPWRRVRSSPPRPERGPAAHMHTPTNGSGAGPTLVCNANGCHTSHLHAQLRRRRQHRRGPGHGDQCGGSHRGEVGRRRRSRPCSGAARQSAARPEGQTLTETAAVWANSPTTITRQWYLCNSTYTACVAVASSNS